MFGWRRRSEGFEWREHVRTTILVRRADRQRRIDDVRMAAVAKVKEQQKRGVDAGKAGLDAAGGVISRAAATLARGLLTAVTQIWRAVAQAAGAAAAALASGASNAARRVPRPNFRFTPQFAERGKRLKDLMPDVASRNPVTLQHLAYGAGALGLIYFGGPILRGETSALGTGITTASIRSSSRDAASTTGASLSDTGGLSGRAIAISGDALRVGGVIVRLSGIDAPEPTQPCFKANGRSWSCSASATNALSRLVRGRSVICDISGTDDSGHKLASCRAGDGGGDIAAELVRNGHVFAQSGLFASYGGDEDSARAAKSGLWQGETVRPDAWRTHAWEEAKRTAPEGCPIKGFVRAESRLYAMPWSNGYSGAKVRSFKGERWFCSEEDARAAGFKLASRS